MSLIETVVALSAQALELEDREIRTHVQGKADSYREIQSGVLRFINERFYQYAITKGLLKHQEHEVQAEVKYHDIILSNKAKGNQAVIEIKRWMTATGNTEIPKIKEDIQKLRSSTLEGEKILLILSVNPMGSTNENRGILLRDIGMQGATHVVKTFETINDKGDQLEFWVCGILC